jgi:hypothetical protein
MQAAASRARARPATHFVLSLLLSDTAPFHVPHPFMQPM